MGNKYPPLTSIRPLPILACICASIASLLPARAAEPEFRVELVTTAVPYPRGLELVDGKLYVLARGRSREVGGVDAKVNDHAGTIYEVDPAIAEPFVPGKAISPEIELNGRIFAAPTSPPFNLWNSGTPEKPTLGSMTDRPYCVLRFHPGTRSFYLCAFSGIDLASDSKQSFVKHFADAMLRYDLRTESWHEVDRHDASARWDYPNPTASPQPDSAPGLLMGPDNCLPLGKYLFAVGKDNSLLVRYDLENLQRDPQAGRPKGEVILGAETPMIDGTTRTFEGHSALAYHDGWLYLAHRTSSTVIRIPVLPDGTVVGPIKAEFLAQLEPYDSTTRKSANITDIAVDDAGLLYILSAKPAAVWRIRPDPKQPLDTTKAAVKPWLDMAALTENPNMKSENIMLDPTGKLYITSADAYNSEAGTHGSVYCVSSPVY